MAFTGPEAFVGYRVPYAHLLASNIDIQVVFGGNQNAALAQVFAGKAKAVGSNSMLIEGYAKREGKKFRELWTSEGYRDLALMASGKVPESDVRAVANAFINMHKDPQGSKILQQAAQEVGLAADAYFIPASDHEYANYRKIYQSAPPALR